MLLLACRVHIAETSVEHGLLSWFVLQSYLLNLIYKQLCFQKLNKAFLKK